MNIKDLAMNDNTINIYPFGSHIYGTNTSKSDYDYIIVVKDYYESDDINQHVYSKEQFQQLVDRHDIQALECLFLDWSALYEKLYKTGITYKHCYDLTFNLDLSKLRVSVSTVASNSWVKGKKKLVIAADYDVELAIKSIFHSLRILDFGIQIASSGKIQNYSSMNWLLIELRKLAEQFQREELWQKIDEKYKKLYNAKATEFKTLAPKDLSEKDKRVQLEKLLSKHALDKKELVNEILEIFQK